MKGKISKVLICPVLAMLMVSTPVFAEDIRDPVSITATGGEFASEVYGDLSYKGPESEEAMFNISAGDSDSQDDYGTTMVTLGNLDAHDILWGVVANAYNEGSRNVLFTGGIDADDGAFFANSENGGEIEAVISGNITTLDNTYHPFSASSSMNSKTEITVYGDIRTGDRAINEVASPYAVEITSDHWAETDVTVNGSIYVKDSNEEISDFALGVSGVTGGKSHVIVDGDISGAHHGVWFGTGEEGEVGITVSGTIAPSDSNGYGVVTHNYDTITFTAWKIIPNSDGNIAGKIDDTGNIIHDSVFEGNIQYIIKIEQPEAGATLSATDEKGKALSQTDSYEWANEGDRVLLKIDLQDGYVIKGAYNGDDEKVPLSQDNNGQYYIDVPKGGGVYLSVEVTGTSVDSTNEDLAGGPNITFTRITDMMVDGSSETAPCTVLANPVATYTADVSPSEEDTIGASSIGSLIVNAASNENVMITLSDRSSLTKEETDLLKKRPDISLTLIFTMDGITYKVTVPAGADLDKYRNASGGIDVITLCELFGYTAV